MLYKVFSSALILLVCSMQNHAMDNENAPIPIKPYEITDEEAKPFIKNFSNLPNEIQTKIIEYVYHDAFEPSIDKYGAYVQSMKLPTGKGETADKQEYWKTIRNFGKITVGPQKNWIIRPRYAKVECINNQYPYKTHVIGAWCENYCYCLHPTKDILIMSHQGGSTLLEICSLEKNSSPNVEHRFFIDITLTGIEYDYTNLNSDVLIAYNHDNVYKLNLVNKSKSQLDDTEIQKIISACELIEKVADKNYLSKNCDYDLYFTRITLSTKFPGLFIAVINNRFSFLCDYNSSNTFIKCLEIIDENIIKQPVSFFCEPQKIFNYAVQDQDYAKLDARRLLRITAKNDFLGKQIFAIAARAKELQKKR